MNDPRNAASQVKSIAEHVEQRFRAGRRVLSFAEFLALFDGQPVRYSRDASRYLRDVFDHYGTTSVRYPWGEATRFRLFDMPWEPAQPAAGASPGATSTGAGAPTERLLPRGALIGQEHVQEEIYRALSNFAREGRPNRLVLLHGPNGSAKSTIAPCMMAALEHYSMLDEGALYRFHWVFPSQKTIRGSLGFGHASRGKGDDSLRPPARRGDRLEALRRGARSPALPHPHAEREGPLRLVRARGGTEPPEWMLRAALAQEPAGVRGAAHELRRLARRGAPARAGRALLHLAPLPRRRGHDRSAAQRRRGRAPDHRGSLSRRAARRAPGHHALRGVRRARRRRRRAARVQRSLEAPARRLQVPAARSRRGKSRSAPERPAQLRHDRQRERAPPRRLPGAP